MSQDFLIIDAHVHTYPSPEIGRQALGSYGYGYSGTIQELEEVMEKANISCAVMANLTPVQEMRKASIAKLPAGLSIDQEKEAIQEIDKKVVARMERRNRWTCELARENPKLSALIGVDILQAPEEMVEELGNKVTPLGAKGLKLHPIANECYPWDKRFWPVYTKAQELGTPILFHAGASELPGYSSEYEGVLHFESVAQSFPDLTIVLAHLGKGYYEDSVGLAARCPNIVFDTSTCFTEQGASEEEVTGKIYDIIRKIGPHRVMFGSDWPWFDPLHDIEVIKSMELTDEEKTMIFGLNAERIYGL
jgi:predicted TIM-barrel fold metal-dependent hydrolase